MSSNSNVATRMVSLPKADGTIAGMGETFTPDPFTGSGRFSVPIALSPGREGFGPRHSLEYSTGNGTGPFGIGWRLNVPEIARKTRKGLPRYTDEDEFLLTGGDDLVPDAAVPPSTYGDYQIVRYRPRREGVFSRIELWQLQKRERARTGQASCFWRVTTSDNVTNIFGATSKAVLADPENGARIFRWCLELSYDGKGNYVHYSYKLEDGQNVPREFYRNSRASNTYPEQIRYGNLKPIDFGEVSRMMSFLLEEWVDSECLFRAIFDYGEYGAIEDGEEVITEDIHVPLRDWQSRGDPFSTFTPGFEVRTYRLCKRVLMFHHLPDSQPMLVESTDFDYLQLEHSQNTILSRVTQRGYRKSSSQGLKQSEESRLGERGIRSYVYHIASMPPLEFQYSQFDPVTSESLPRCLLHFDQQPDQTQPRGLENRNYALIDLFSRGLPDILETRRDGYSYWRNLGNGRFSDIQTLDSAPRNVILSDNGVGLADITGEGYPDLLEFSGQQWGYYPGVSNSGWGDFRALDRQPGFGLQDLNLRLLDVTGDGSFDALRTDLEEFVLFECLGAEGFAAPKTITRVHDWERFPDVRFADPNVHLADMTGDGLADIVLVEPRRIHYWPNLGFGRFGQRVTMDIPALAQFKPEQMFFVDIDGSGPTDLVHVESGRIRFWMNRSGNKWSDVYEVTGTPAVPNPESIKLVDMLGTGMVGIVWSSPAGFDAYRYLPLASGGKPGLLTAVSNNMGLTIRFDYRPSTELALEADAEGKPWVGHLPFPVYVLSRVEKIDAVAHTKLTTEYRYAHGCYDEKEREFVGFGRVDQVDTESTGAGGNDDDLVKGLHQPPVLTRTWYHTGVCSNDGTVSRQYLHEYYAQDNAACLLPDTTLPEGLSADEQRDALRALTGRVLRQETFALDGSVLSAHPYAVSERTYRLRCIQHAVGGARAVFSAREGEVLQYHYERSPHDPRITHELALEADEFDHVTLSASMAYPRRTASNPEPEQNELVVAVTCRRYGQETNCPAGYRHGVPMGEQVFQLTGVATPIDGLLSAAILRQSFANAAVINYEDEPAAGELQKRCISWTRYTYWDDQAVAVLPEGEVGLHALLHNVYQAAFTPGLLAVYGDKLDTDVLESEGGYVLADGVWWIPSGPTQTGQQVFDPKRFYLPVEVIDPFGNCTTISYDRYALLIEGTRDPLGNMMTALNDYRTLSPCEITDANGNRQGVATDVLGMVVGTAVMGKPGENLGDSLADFEPDLAYEAIARHLDDPLGVCDTAVRPGDILGKAGTRLVYDLWAYYRTRSTPKPRPITVYTLARETHQPDLKGGEHTKIRHSFSYFDGFAREIQKKIQAEPGMVPKRDADGNLIVSPDGQLEMAPGDVSPRWVGSGWTIFNNKGKPVRQYEPFFTDTHRFEFARIVGVCSVLFYDPVDRVVAVMHPNNTYEKAIFDPWKKTSWDVNDTVLLDPRTDADVRGFTEKYFAALDAARRGWQTWHAARVGGATGVQEQTAASKAGVHAGTPTIVSFDALGRLFLTIADNGTDASGVRQLYSTRVNLDIEGNQREVIDAKGRVVMCYDYDMLSNHIHQASMEAGERWMLNDAGGKPIYAWDSRGHQFRTTYDELRRPKESYLREGAGPELLVGRTVYGETQPTPEAGNLRGKVVQVFDQAGVVTSDDYDFKGNVLCSRRQLAAEYKTTLDWSAAPALETVVYTSRMRYDALNRPIQLIAPHSDQPGAKRNVIQPRYNEANLLERVDVWLDHPTEPCGLLDAALAPPSLVGVNNIDYNAKGQRLRIDYGNGATTRYEYDPFTFRLVHLMTTRPANANGLASQLFKDPGTVQDLHYTYDPVGNITEIADAALPSIFHANEQVDPVYRYTYDALYRLIEAKGREHIDQSAFLANPPNGNYRDYPFLGAWQHNSPQAVRNYTEQYVYDPVGNFDRMIHQAASGDWTRAYAYNEPSQLEAGKVNNRLSGTTIGGSAPEAYDYDAHGNMLRMPHLPLMQWDYRDQLQATAQQVVNNGGTPETTWYVYDAAGQRVRKVTERQAAAGQTPARMKERIYLDGFEIYREYGGDGSTITLERETLHIMDDKQRIALVETRTLDTAGNDPAPPQLSRYQLGNHLGSASLELDDQAQIISYEEYYPYGSTSYQAARSQSETSKRYRYTGKERDEESGLYYQGARYHAAWLGRWTSADPSGLADGVNRYTYVLDSPVARVDGTGLKYQPLVVNAQDPNEPLNYASLQEFSRRAVGPWTEEGLRARWAERQRDVWQSGVQYWKELMFGSTVGDLRQPDRTTGRWDPRSPLRASRAPSDTLMIPSGSHVPSEPVAGEATAERAERVWEEPVKEGLHALKGAELKGARETVARVSNYYFKGARNDPKSYRLALTAMKIQGFLDKSRVARAASKYVPGLSYGVEAVASLAKVLLAPSGQRARVAVEEGGRMIGVFGGGAAGAAGGAALVLLLGSNPAGWTVLVGMSIGGVVGSAAGGRLVKSVAARAYHEAEETRGAIERLIYQVGEPELYWPSF